MFTTLRKIAGGAAVIPVRPQPRQAVGTASLWKQMPCRKCGEMLRLIRITPLSPHGIRGYYLDRRGHVVTIDRSFVSTKVGEDNYKIYFR